MNRKTATITTKPTSNPSEPIVLRQTWSAKTLDKWIFWCLFPSTWTDLEIIEYCERQMNELTFTGAAVQFRRTLKFSRMTYYPAKIRRSAGRALVTQHCELEM